ncbi:MAG: hypothetical protein Q9162_005651 [Coniocarpon cinnabarinum]
MDYFSRALGRRDNAGNNNNNNNDGEQASSRPSSSRGLPQTPATPMPPTPGSQARNPAPMRLRRLPTTGQLRPPSTPGPSASGRRSPGRSPARPPSRLDEMSESIATPASTTTQDFASGRRRSSSDPQRPQAAYLSRPEVDSNAAILPTVVEERPTNTTPQAEQPFATPPADTRNTASRMLNASAAAAKRSRADSIGERRGGDGAARSMISSGLAARANRGRARTDAADGRGRRESTASTESVGVQDDMGRPYESEVTDFLDVIDPEVSTLNTLNNVQNSLFIPYLGRWYNRQPTYTLTRPPTRTDMADLPAAARTQSMLARLGQEKPGKEDIDERESDEQERPDGLHRLHTIKSTLSGMSVGHNYAVLPHGVHLEGWSEEEMEELNDHVRHLLHSRREGFKRSMRAFGKYVQKPMGAFVTIYAFIITFWGAAWVIFLIGWIHAGNRQEYFVEICDQILTAMLVVFGITLFPWRCVDTYHMIYIAHYHYKVWKLRAKRGLPMPRDPNDLPDTDPRISTMLDPEEAAEVRAKAAEDEAVMLPLEQQKKLKHHQEKMARSHTFYKPHETLTHHAFPIKLLITCVVLLDFHSFFQMALGGTTWGIYYRHRPKALTTVILCFSITCNIASAVVISIGDHKTRKKAVFEQMFRQEQTNLAMKRMEKERGKERMKVSTNEEELEREHKELKKRVEGLKEVDSHGSAEESLKNGKDHRDVEKAFTGTEP